MGLPVAKVTFSFAQGVMGWTENYFLASPSTDLKAEMALADTLAAKRIQLSGVQTTIPYIKVSNEAILRDVLVQGTDYAGTAIKDSDSPDVAILTYRTATTPAVSAPLYLRGIWDELIVRGGEINRTNTAWIAVYNGWMRQLIRDRWGFLAKDSTASQKSEIANVVQQGDGTVRITATNGIFVGLDPTKKLKCFVSGVQGAVGINGPNVYKIISGAVVQTVDRLSIFPYTTGGYISFTQPTFYPISDTRIERVVERKAGRPLYVSRGRRSARAKS